MRRAEIQVVMVPVSDADRAKEFSAGKLGWHVDHTFQDPDGNRWTLQQTPIRG